MAWEIDMARSHAWFYIRQRTRNTVQGHFSAVRGYLNVDEETPVHTWMDVEVDAPRVDHEADARDAQTHSIAWSEAADALAFTFRSLTVKHMAAAKSFQVSGELTMRGIMRIVTFDAELHQHLDGAGVRRVVLTARAKITGKDFRIPFGGTFAEPRHVVVGDIVTLEIDLALLSRAVPTIQLEMEPEVVNW